VTDDGRIGVAAVLLAGLAGLAVRGTPGSRAKLVEDVAAEGPRAVIVWGRRCNGSQPGKRFLEDQDPADQAVIERLFSYYVRGVSMDKTQFRIEKDAGCDETVAVFKSFQVRLFAVLSGQVGGRGRVVITHGYTKKQDKARPNEFTRVCKLFAEHERVMRGDCGQGEEKEPEVSMSEPDWRKDLERRHGAFVEQQRRKALERAVARAEEQAELQRLLEQQRRQVALRAAARAEDQAELQRMLEEQRQRMAPPATRAPRAARKPARRWTPYVEASEEILALIRRALAEGSELELDYVLKTGGAVSSRVQPERLASKGDQIVLVGLDADEGRPLSYFLDRIRRVRARPRSAS
jgi:hypothetical protein